MSDREAKRRHVSLLLAGALLLSLGVRADPVRLDSSGRARPVIRVYHRGGDSPLKTCAGGCSVDLPRGRYRVAIDATPGTYAYDEDIRVRGPTRVAIDPGDKTTRRTSIIVGWTLVGASLGMLTWAMFSEWPDNRESGEKGHFGGASIVGSVLGGAGLCFLIAAASNKPSIQAQRVSFGAAPTTGGAMLGGLVVF
ncbi:MAG: hypothetical protein HYV09_39490 [Deltaproteobacteria bacterium]|nr:hypothetical protein [Deltaproteobacteria bacterium]